MPEPSSLLSSAHEWPCYGTDDMRILGVVPHKGNRVDLSFSSLSELRPDLFPRLPIVWFFDLKKH